MVEPVPILAIGDLKSELSRWSDETPVTFRSPLNEQEFRFYRSRPAENLLVLEINKFPETSPEVLPNAWVRSKARPSPTVLLEPRHATAKRPVQ
jgi:hypothetical protein